ncbi:hypothetical protein [Pseudoalteromonas sp. R3]|uniref:hypothetical protein n=1 Tax=Pseudoalteromonas sp. R3 TaxID=1709477 RepID=UPI0006B5E950|nr:hypothetical protein [Pseudoalteromonas sp. R3]AZZ98793.1 hypothetical protein ELR70_17815 [Pseudoalteromonas sp. R3]
MNERKVWTSLEIVKLVVSVLTPLLLLWLGMIVNVSIQETEHAIRKAEEAREIQRINQLAIQSLAKRVYERRSRAELLASSLKRNVSLEETIERKTNYDDAYFQWNKDHQANLLLVRSVLGSQQYSEFESMIEFYLVRKIFSPLDRCLTKAYDYRMTTGNSGKGILLDCNANELLQQALDCGYALTDELFKLTERNGSNQRAVSSNVIKQRCSAE